MLEGIRFDNNGDDDDDKDLVHHPTCNGVLTVLEGIRFCYIPKCPNMCYLLGLAF